MIFMEITSKYFAQYYYKKKLEMNTVRSNIVKVKLYSGKK